MSSLAAVGIAVMELLGLVLLFTAQTATRRVRLSDGQRLPTQLTVTNGAGSARRRGSARRWIVCCWMLAVALVLSSCSHGNDYYRRAPYPGGIDPALASSESSFAAALSAGNRTMILNEWTAPPWAKQMRNFLAGYAGHRARVAGQAQGYDATAREALSIRCSAQNVQRVWVSWAWFNGAWRAWPDQRVLATGKVLSYPGCRTP